MTTFLTKQADFARKIVHIPDYMLEPLKNFSYLGKQNPRIYDFLVGTELTRNWPRFDNEIKSYLRNKRV